MKTKFLTDVFRCSQTTGTIFSLIPLTSSGDILQAHRVMRVMLATVLIVCPRWGS